MSCQWCESDKINHEQNTVYWELPDGTKAIQIKAVPCITCLTCGIEYQEEAIVDTIEEQLLLINTEQIQQSITYEELLAIPRLLKKNYFKF
ncbi:YokU family protein [Cytobacillus sp. IB215665]|uniref:YokU family protein n=1 Tax=Cytobacillus sp. IB215665 TaxID=3097357 RepID=UPI002A146FAE|nr:YokU family protein [Cytobacillus sp. IB215665]MDX8366251.1 YokU family protein [Cytobacillus sp. IB215665]